MSPEDEMTYIMHIANTVDTANLTCLVRFSHFSKFAASKTHMLPLHFAIHNLGHRQTTKHLHSGHTSL